MHVCRKNVVPLHRKILLIWFNFKRFNTILNRKILLNLIRKIKNLTDQFQPVFVFALATLNSYILFLHCNFTTCYTVLYLIPESSITIDIAERELVCFVHLCHHPGSQFTKLFTRAIFIRRNHCSYIFVPRLAFRVHVAGDMNKTISFVVDRRYLDFVRSCLTRAHPLETELPYAVELFSKIKLISD